jgi:hypothetical protein
MAVNLSGVLLRLVSVIVHLVTVVCLDTSVELSRIETVNIESKQGSLNRIKTGLARERCDIK